VAEDRIAAYARRLEGLEAPGAVRQLVAEARREVGEGPELEAIGEMAAMHLFALEGRGAEPEVLRV